ncbi:MAG: DUF3800 domain-containing protein [Ignavibacteriae bacterium]|nr:DUF3800 domain-containing protein [Ignavibacteriota bacterium]
MSKYFLFLDESGDHGLIKIDPNFPVFVLTGIILTENSYLNIGNQIKELKKKFWGDKKVILHSSDIRKHENEFSILFDQDIKKEFYEILNTILSQSDYKIISSAIKKKNYVNLYGKLHDDVYQISLSFIIERAVFYLDSQFAASNSLSIYIEKRGKKEDNQLKEHFQKLKNRGSGFVSPSRIKNYCNEIKFYSKKDDIIGLQISDLIAYPIARYVLDQSRANPSFDVINSKFYSKGTRRFGLKIYP